MSIIVFDTETTGLLAPYAAGQDFQPYLVELYAIKLSDDLERISSYTFRCKPPIEIPNEAINVHGITNADVKDCPPFVHFFLPLADYFLGSTTIVGHNLLYDKTVLYWELFRLGKTLSFPWSIRGICTAETTQQQLGHRLNLADLHMKLFGGPFSGAHSASIDCEITAKCFIEMVKQEMIVL